MATYTTVPTLKSYLGIDTTTDDLLLQEMLSRASQKIDTYCDRGFTALTETRYFDSDAYDPSTGLLWMDKDLLTVATLTNGDSDGTSISSSDYWLWPRNATPYYAIKLKSDVTTVWEWDVDYWVTVTGTWGFSAAPPEDIVHATIRLASYYYYQKDSGIYETQVFPEAGVVAVPSGFPEDVREILNPYRRVV